MILKIGLITKQEYEERMKAFIESRMKALTESKKTTGPKLWLEIEEGVDPKQIGLRITYPDRIIDLGPKDVPRKNIVVVYKEGDPEKIFFPAYSLTLEEVKILAIYFAHIHHRVLNGEL